MPSCLAEAEDGTGVTTIILADLQQRLESELLHLLLQDLVLSFELLVIFFEFLFLLFKLAILKAVVVFLHRKFDKDTMTAKAVACCSCPSPS